MKVATSDDGVDGVINGEANGTAGEGLRLERGPAGMGEAVRRVPADKTVARFMGEAICEEEDEEELVVDGVAGRARNEDKEFSDTDDDNESKDTDTGADMDDM
jgi:hypothetical protein